jgi:hypothetical protein
VADVTITKVVYDDLNAGKSFEFSIMIPVGGTKIRLTESETIKAAIYDKDDKWVKDVTIKVKGDDGTADVVENGTHFFLSDGQYLKIAGAPAGMCYYVKEIDADKDGFSTDWEYNQSGGLITPAYVNTAKGYDDTTEKLAAKGQTKDQINAQVNTNTNTIIYTNTRSVSPDNGISVDVVPYVIVMAIAVAGIAVILLKKRNTSR